MCEKFLTVCAFMLTSSAFSSVVAEEPDLPPAGTTTVVVLPDTQRLTQRYHDSFRAQTRWVADQHEKRNINYVVHLGDITQDDLPREWEVGRACMDMLDGKVPYLVVPGNHDYHNKDTGEALTRESRMRVIGTRINEYYGPERFKDWPTFGGVFEEGRIDNNYHLTNINGQDWIILGLEYGPRDEVLEWANEVLAKYKNHRAMIITHAYLFRGNVRYDQYKGSMRASPAGWGNDGEEQWNKLVRKHPNVMVVISGHVRTGGPEGSYLASEGDYGNTVHQMMTNYQKWKGAAYLRLLEFLPDGKTVRVRTYSPILNQKRESSFEHFEFTLQGPTRDEPRPVAGVAAEPLKTKPIHRFSFGGPTGTAEGAITDSIGGTSGQLHGDANLDGKGKVVLDVDDHVELDPKIMAGREDASFELWFTPTGDAYNWHSAVSFHNGNQGRGGHYFNYRFRTLAVHRAAVSLGNNDDIQRVTPTRRGKPMHVVVTYDADGGGEGKALLSYYRDGENFGHLATGIKLKDIQITKAGIGPCAGVYDELRIYDYPLSAGEVAGNYNAGPDAIVVKSD